MVSFNNCSGPLHNLVKLAEMHVRIIHFEYSIVKNPRDIRALIFDMKRHLLVLYLVCSFSPFDQKDPDLRVT